MKKDRTHLIFNKAYYTMIYIMAIVVVILLAINTYIIVKSLPEVITSGSRRSLDELIA